MWVPKQASTSAIPHTNNQSGKSRARSLVTAGTRWSERARAYLQATNLASLSGRRSKRAPAPCLEAGAETPFLPQAHRRTRKRWFWDNKAPAVTASRSGPVIEFIQKSQSPILRAKNSRTAAASSKWLNPLNPNGFSSWLRTVVSFPEKASWRARSQSALRTLRLAINTGDTK